MIGQAYPLFKSSRILRREMLEAITDYTFLFGELLYTGYSNGILSGCRLTTTKDTIIVNPGIISYNQKLYLIKEPLMTTYYPTNKTCLFILRFQDEIRTESLVYREIVTEIVEKETRLEGTIELCRFKLQEGAKLRCEYTNFKDRGTEYDTLNGIHTPYAAIEHSTLSPELLKSFAREMLACDGLKEYDLSFCFMLLNGNQPTSLEVIHAYLNKRLGISSHQMGNKEVFTNLCKVLDETRNGYHSSKESHDTEWKVFID